MGVLERKAEETGFSGTTLVELVLVMVLLSLVAFVIVPKFDAYNQVELKTAVKHLAADFKYAQAQAIATRVRYGLIFDPAADSYTVYRGDPATAAPDFFDPGAVMRRHWTRVDVLAADFDGAASVEFNSMGVPYNASGVELSNAGLVVLTEGAELDTVRVLQLTGRVEY